MSPNQPRRILITGATGTVGGVISKALLQRGHAVRGFDLRPNPGLPDSLVGDLTDPAALDRAMRGIDTLIHLAAYPDDGDFMSQILPANIIGAYQVFEAAHRAGVTRAVVTSSIQTVNALPRPQARPLAVADGSWPTNTYGVSKVFLEELGKMYAARKGMGVIGVRLGWFSRAPMKPSTKLNGGHDIYLSRRDAAQFFVRAVESERPKPGQCVILYANSRPVYGLGQDLASAAEWLGYIPQQGYPEGLEDIGREDVLPSAPGL